nr:PREDICTED: probable G-protein coupled receptor 158 [Latimeria chalumnae]|eukprot:XP_006010391.1 PREDICTED: probable G-protein coupled receptor 158 [Latimeria chalumnae]
MKEDMAVFFLFLSLLLQREIVFGTNRGFEGRTAYYRDKAFNGKQPIYNSNRNMEKPLSLWSRSTEGTMLAQKLAANVPQTVAAFLYTGDASDLRHDNCSRRLELKNLIEILNITSHSFLHSALDTIIHATNFLNMILQTNKSREQNLQGDIDWYHALVRSVLTGDPKILRAIVTFNIRPFSSTPLIFLQATRKDNEIFLQDLSLTSHLLENATLETEWFNIFKHKRRPNLHKKVLHNDFKTIDSALKRGESYVVDRNHIKWSAPYLECENGKYKPPWLLTLSAAFYGLKPNFIPEFRGVVRVDISLQDVDIDQCSSDGWFAGTHRCELNSTECIPEKRLGFVLGAYKCICKAGFYYPSSLNSFERKDKDNYVPGGKMSDEVYVCLPCREGCSYCTDDTPCYAQEDKYLRIATISFQTLCMLLDFISMLVVYRFRKTKVKRSAANIPVFWCLCLKLPVVSVLTES